MAGAAVSAGNEPAHRRGFFFAADAGGDRFLRSFQPQAEPVRQTITALAEQLRMVVEQEPARFAEVADQFAGLRPIYVRRLLEGLDAKARNDGKLVWGPVLKLLENLMARRVS